MASVVNFPSGYNLDRSSDFRWSTGVEVDYDDAGNYNWMERGESWVTIDAKFNMLTAGEADTLQNFLITNAANFILWTPDTQLLLGTIVGGVRRSMTGPRYNIAFKFYGQVFAL